MHIIKKMTKRTFTLILKKYGLECDVEKLYKYGFYNATDVYYMDHEDIERLRLNGTWAQYCFMYKTETGKEHKYP